MEYLLLKSLVLFTLRVVKENVKYVLKAGTSRLTNRSLQGPPPKMTPIGSGSPGWAFRLACGT